MQKQYITGQDHSIDYEGQLILRSGTASNRFSETIDYVSTGTHNRLYLIIDYTGRF